jgi:hypothetical protein
MDKGEADRKVPILSQTDKVGQAVEHGQQNEAEQKGIEATSERAVRVQPLPELLQREPLRISMARSMLKRDIGG